MGPADALVLNQHTGLQRAGNTEIKAAGSSCDGDVSAEQAAAGPGPNWLRDGGERPGATDTPARCCVVSTSLLLSVVLKVTTAMACSLRWPLVKESRLMRCDGGEHGVKGNPARRDPAPNNMRPDS
ncbi:unnamed protein product [Arctogadus glacialis]